MSLSFRGTVLRSFSKASFNTSEISTISAFLWSPWTLVLIVCCMWGCYNISASNFWPTRFKRLGGLDHARPGHPTQPPAPLGAARLLNHPATKALFDSECYVSFLDNCHEARAHQWQSILVLCAHEGLILPLKWRDLTAFVAMLCNFNGFLMEHWVWALNCCEMGMWSNSFEIMTSTPELSLFQHKFSSWSAMESASRAWTAWPREKLISQHNFGYMGEWIGTLQCSRSIWRSILF